MCEKRKLIALITDGAGVRKILEHLGLPTTAPTLAPARSPARARVRDLTDKRLRRGAFRSVPELITAIHGYIDEHNDEPKPFVWRKTVEEILTKVRRARAVLDNAATE